MTATTISFNKTGYDPFIDFLKAYAIIFVIVAHNFPTVFWNYCLFQVWADMQAPIFILIQVFHAYKKGNPPTIKWSSLLKRIVLPFVAIQGIILSLRLFFSSESTHNVLISSVIGGGYGPGSYYFWIYIQVAFILVWIWPLVKKLTRKQITWLFLLLSIGCEVLFSVINLPDYVYRLLAVRYLFLIPLALIWVDKGVELNAKNVLLSIVSIAAVIFFSFSKLDLEPLFYQTGWSTHRWICYFYLPILLTYALWLVFNQLKKSETISLVIKEIAKCSYEIYLFQMLVFVALPASRLDFISSVYLRLPLWMVLTFLFSIVGGILLNRMLQIIYTVKTK